ncbi:MAG: hypothetical protein QOJ64_407 [Acidobacteriota bacterium]|nr:hypothetical protein [Acidobacteriota bacterium]
MSEPPAVAGGQSSCEQPPALGCNELLDCAIPLALAPSNNFKAFHGLVTPNSHLTESGRRLVAPQLERRERTNRDVVSVRIPERKLLCSSIRVRVRLIFEPDDERACPFQCDIEIVDAEEQEEPVARCRVVRARQRRMLVCAPLMKAEQDRSIRVEDLTKVVMCGSCLGLAEE